MNWVCLACSADGTRLVAGVGGQRNYGSLPSGPIYTSTNSGRTWISNSVPMLEWQSVASSADGNRQVAVASGGGIYVRESTPTPILSIMRSGSDLLLSWLVPSMNFALQQNPDLTATNWTDVAITPTINLTNLEYQATIPAPADTMFYRLKSQ